MKNIIVLIFSFLTIVVQSQLQECGTITSAEDMQAFYNRERAPQNSLKAGNIVDVPVVYHITRMDDGTGGFDLAETFRLHCDLNERFENAEIYFYILDIVEHNNTSYYNMTYSGVGNTMMNTENNSNACNIFIVNEAKSGSTPVCGYSFLASGWGGPNRGGVILDIGCSGANSTTLTHEMGHYLNLPHTFYGWEGRDYSLSPISQNQWERADGSNCLTTADGFCDTPADYISDRWACSFPKIFPDAIGQVITVDEKNYMSYSLDGCQTYFKQDQMNEMKGTPSTYRPYLTNLTAPNTAALAVPELIFPPNNINGLSLGTVDFTWEAVPMATHYQVEFTYGSFNNIIFKEVVTTNSFSYSGLNSGTNYNWRVKAINYGSVCNEFKEGSFTMSTFTASVTLDDVFCNSASDGNAYAATTEGPISSYNWFALDVNSGAFNNFDITTTNAIHNLSPNEYYVELVKSNGAKSIVPFTIVEPLSLDVQLSQNTNAVLSTVTGGTPPYSYLWSDASTSPQNSNPIVGDGNTLYLTDANGCFISKSFTFSSGVIAIKDLANNIINLMIYPNPVKGDYVYMNFVSKNNMAVSLELFSVDAKLIRNYTREVSIGENTLKLPIPKIGKGVYFIKFTINNNSITRKLIL